jgi:D-3-phosphoglycerate dehydrogenase
MPRILVADKIAEPGLERLRAASDVTFDVRHGLPPAELARAVAEYDGLLIRSAVTVTADVLAHPGKLRAIARAGVGVDNVDLDAATAAGVLVLNTPDANTISTAEHTFAVMLALHRRIAAAHAHLIGGGWNRAAYEGEQLAGMTLGVVGYGRIGRAVARRALAFEMEVIVFDPFVTPSTSRNESVTFVDSLHALLQRADCVTLHATLSPDTDHMIGPAELSAMKPSATIVNCARGALIDESALADALNADRIGGAALDVYEHEPPTDSPLLSARNVVLTPHLAASTAEAQTRVSVDAVDALVAYLLRGEIRSAVNVTGLPAQLSPRARSFIDLAGRMGTILSPWCAAGVDRISLTVNGDSLAEVAATLALQAMTSVLGPHVDTRLNLVNAKGFAADRGIVVEHTVQPIASGRPDSIVVTAHARGETHSIEGTVLADRQPRVLAIDGYRMEVVPERTLVLIFNDDQPGVIGLVGRRVGDAGINIADMALSRRDRRALMLLKLDAPLPDAVRDALRASNPPILSVRTISLPPASSGSAEA